MDELNKLDRAEWKMQAQRCIWKKLCRNWHTEKWRKKHEIWEIWVTKLGLLNGWLRSIESWVNEGKIFKMLRNNVYNLRHESKNTGKVMNISGKTKANSLMGTIQWICKTTKLMEEGRHCRSRSTDIWINKSHSIMDQWQNNWLLNNDPRIIGF